MKGRTKVATARKRCTSEGCRRLRRDGQRTCQQCHAQEMRERRQRAKNMKPAERIEKAMVHVAMSKRGKPLSPEFEAQLNALAATVAEQIASFNQKELLC
jgi:mono/diheme cytochrome c family protein